MMQDVLKKVVEFYSLGIFIYFVLINFTYIFLILISIRRLRKFTQIVNSDVTSIGEYTIPITIIVPAYNEEATIIENILSLLALDYPNYEIVVVNDGSKDNTLNLIIEHFNLRSIEQEKTSNLKTKDILGVYSSFELPNLIIVDKLNGGKSDALNVGINFSKNPLFCAIDADCVIEKDALLRIIKPFLKYDDMIAVGGMVRIANGCRIEYSVVCESSLPHRLIEKFQIIEYFRAFLTSRVGWETLNGLLIISGAFGLFKKSAVLEVGGYTNTIGEDMELTLKLHEHYRKNKKKYKIDFTSDAVCWTQAPSHFKDLRGQRLRWHRGLADSILKHKKMMFNPKYGVIGMFSMPYFFLIELIGPIIEIIGYLVMLISIFTGLISWFFIFVFAMAYLFGLFFSISAVLLEKLSYNSYKKPSETMTLVVLSMVEQVCYRQITVWWRFKSFFNFKKGSQTWGHIQRRSFRKKSNKKQLSK